jgi:hypothetical protein
MLWVFIGLAVLAALALGVAGAIILTKVFLEVPEENHDKEKNNGYQ